MRVKVAKDADEQPGIFALSFTNGLLNADGGNPVASSTVYRNQQNEITKKLVLSVGGMEYVGNYDDTKKRNAGKYLGVEDEATGEMTIIPLKRVKLRSAVGQAEGEEVVPVTKPEKNWIEKQNNLIEVFGAIKQKEGVLRRQKHGIDKDMVRGAFDTADILSVAQSVAASPATTPTTEQNQSILPAYDADTTTPADIYPLDGHFPEAVRNSLVDYVADFRDATPSTLAQWKAAETVPHFILQQLSNLPFDEDEKLESLCLLKYLLVLMKVYKLKYADWQRKDPTAFLQKSTLTQISPTCSQYLLDTLTVVGETSQRRSYPTRMKDKTLIFILLIALRLGSFKLDCRNLIKDVLLGSKKFAEICKGIGCKVSSVKLAASNEASIIIELKAPLKLPEARIIRKKR